jgi:hypothetical protein
MASLLDLAQARLGGLLAPQRPSMAGLLGGRQQTGTLAGALQGYTPPQMTAMTNPQVMDYARNVAQSAQQNLQTQMSDLDKALVMDQGGINVGDRQALARLMEQVPGLMGATAYHASPNVFTQFDKSKIGSTTGVDYGFGGYFAQSPKVAEDFKSVAGREYLVNGKKVMDVGTPERRAIPLDEREKIPFQQAYFAAEEFGGFNNAIKATNDRIKEAKKLKDVDLVEYYQEILDELKPFKDKSFEVKPLGNVYKVDVPDEYIPKMLDWNVPIGQQSKEIQEILKSNKVKFKPTDSTEEVYFNVIEKVGGSDNTKSGFQKASEYLDSIGIKGIKYLDKPSMEQSEAYLQKHGGTRNFVVFDPINVKMLERNQTPIEGLLD